MRQVISHTPDHFTAVPITSRLSGPKNWSGLFEKENILLPSGYKPLIVKTIA